MTSQVNLDILNYPAYSSEDFQGIQALARAVFSTPHPPVDTRNRSQTLEQLASSLTDLDAECLQKVVGQALALIKQTTPLGQTLHETFWCAHKRIDVTKTMGVLKQVLAFLHAAPAPHQTGHRPPTDIPQPEEARILVERANQTTQTPLALLRVRRALQLDPSLALAHRLHAALLRKEGALEAALKAVETSLRFNTNDHAARSLKAEIELEQLDQALQHDPTDTASLMKRALLWFEWDEYTKALEDLGLMISSQPDSVDALVLRGTLYLEQARRKTQFRHKKVAKAHRDFDHVLKIDPHNAIALAGKESLRNLHTGHRRQ